MELADLNPTAIALAAFVSGALGALWYSPVLLGPAWMRALGRGEDDLGPAAPALAGSVVSCIVAACAVDLLAASIGVAAMRTAIRARPSRMRTIRPTRRLARRLTRRARGSPAGRSRGERVDPAA